MTSTNSGGSNPGSGGAPTTTGSRSSRACRRSLVGGEPVKVRVMEGFSASASDMFKIAVNVAGFGASELLLEIFKHRHGEKITENNVTAAMSRLRK